MSMATMPDFKNPENQKALILLGGLVLLSYIVSRKEHVPTIAELNKKKDLESSAALARPPLYFR